MIEAGRRFLASNEEVSAVGVQDNVGPGGADGKAGMSVRAEHLARGMNTPLANLEEGKGREKREREEGRT